MDCTQAVGELTAPEGSCPVMSTQKAVPCTPPSSVVHNFGYTDVFRHRRAPGRQGMLCGINPRGSSNFEGCREGLACLPLQGSTGFRQFYNLGFCSNAPAGKDFGIYTALQSLGAPQPMALFPLADRSTLNSVLLPGTRGRSKDLQVSQDPVFTSTVACDAAHRSAVVLDSVPYMSNGAFTINFWLKTHEPAGTEQQSPSSAKQVIFSHQNRPEGHAQAEEVSIALLPGGGINVTVADGNDSLQGMSRGQCLHINGTYVRTTSENDEVVPIDISGAGSGGEGRMRHAASREMVLACAAVYLPGTTCPWKQLRSCAIMTLHAHSFPAQTESGTC